MSILSITKTVTYFVETDDSEYRRSERGTWERRMGESWEACYDDAEIEAAFQAFLPVGDRNSKNGSEAEGMQDLSRIPTAEWLGREIQERYYNVEPDPVKRGNIKRAMRVMARYETVGELLRAAGSYSDHTFKRGVELLRSRNVGRRTVQIVMDILEKEGLLQ